MNVKSFYKIKKRFLKLVSKYSKNGKPVLECRAGTGLLSVIINI